MLQELWAKVTANERFVAYGAAVTVVGWVLGLILGNKTFGGGNVAGVQIPGVSYNYFTEGNAGLFAILAVVLAVLAVIAIYVRHAPDMTFAWPVPYAQALLAISAAAAVCAILTLLFQVTGPLSDPPVLMYVADLVLIGGAGFAAFGAYQEWNLTKANTPPNTPPTA